MSWRNLLSGAIAVLCIQSITAKDIQCELTPKPDFKVPGRRISEEKCLEYNWERNNVEKCSKEPAHTEYPYVGMIGERNEDGKEPSYVCGAFLISPRFAMTAAYCVDFEPESVKTPITLRLGNSNIKADVPRVDVKVKKIIKHPEFQIPKRFDYIALLELEEELPITKSVQPICLWHSSLDGVRNLFSPGWGEGIPHTAEAGNDEVRDTLRVMKVESIDYAKCEPLAKTYFNQMWKDWTGLKEHQLCANNSISDNPLGGGSAGTSLVTVGNLAGTADQVPYAVGVASISLECCRVELYTKISNFIDWIEETVWSN